VDQTIYGMTSLATAATSAVQLSVNNMKATMIESGSCVIDPWDLVRLPSPMLSLNPLLSIAATHGCPVDGVLYPQPLADVTYTRINHSDGKIEIRWEPTK
jgi:hypothetical protein